jgi:hypothetical protein
MRSGQRKPVVVLLNVFDRDLPSADGVALLAVGAQLALMNVGVAILAALSDIAENHFDVTLRAGHGSVHAAQGVACPIVIKFGNSADRLPSAGGMAVLTRHVQTPVRTVRAARGLCLHAAHDGGERQDR